MSSSRAFRAKFSAVHSILSVQPGADSTVRWIFRQFTREHFSSLQIAPPYMLPIGEPRPPSRRSSGTQIMYLNHHVGCHGPRLFMAQFQHMMVQWSGSHRLRPHNQLPVTVISCRFCHRKTWFRCIQLSLSGRFLCWRFGPYLNCGLLFFVT